jgi:hypothetical protein
MAAPTFVQAAGGGLGQVGSVSFPVSGPTGTVGNVVLLGVMSDGTGGAPTASATSRVSNLAGTTSSLTTIGTVDVGSAAAASLSAFIGRINTTGTYSVTVTLNGSGNDVYCEFWEFTNVNSGSTLADVIENTTAGTYTSGAGTSNTIADAAVVTIGADRLAVNLIGVNDDNAIDAMTGMTGGTWSEPSADYGSATGTDGQVGVQIAAMASAGTINGGTDVMAASDAWGVMGFALIGTTSASAPSLIWQPAAPTPYRL